MFSSMIKMTTVSQSVKKFHIRKKPSHTYIASAVTWAMFGLFLWGR